jgi:hypothetical protein
LQHPDPGSGEGQAPVGAVYDGADAGGEFNEVSRLKSAHSTRLAGAGMLWMWVCSNKDRASGVDWALNVRGNDS